MIFSFKKLKGIDHKTEILSGLTVALALVPEAVAFALVAGVSPILGLYAAFMVCFITSAFGGRPGMISGATGALAVVMVSLVNSHGVEYLFATVVLMGFIQVAIGLLKLGKFIRLVPAPVIYGFVNGLAIIIGMAQIQHFKSADGSWLESGSLMLMLGLCAATMAIIYLLPKISKVIPAPLAAILTVSAIAIGLDLDTKTVGDLASIKAGLPSFHFPEVPFTLETLKIILPYSLILAGIGLIESLLTLTLIDEMTETRGQGNRECKAQGFANIVTGFFGGMGGCAMIGQSIINVSSGGRSRLSGIVAAISLLIFILFASGLIEQIPMAALVGLMFMVSIGTFEWATFKILHKVPKSDAIIIIAVTVLTLVFDLAIAVLAGVILAALVFAWDNSVRIRARKSVDENGAKLYEIYGPLFFGSIATFHEKFDPQNDPEDVIVDFKESRVVDQSGIEALNQLTQRYSRVGKRVCLRHLSQDCLTLLGKAGSMVECNIEEDPNYTVATDALA
ncbi:MAG: SulP family inorganic anion transporter [Bacteriovoracaceae bacterium]|nr:SulP family inorganic anion transporter [Bacteriovoracaceae bacterium]